MRFLLTNGTSARSVPDPYQTLDTTQLPLSLYRLDGNWRPSDALVRLRLTKHCCDASPQRQAAVQGTSERGPMTFGRPSAPAPHKMLPALVRLWRTNGRKCASRPARTTPLPYNAVALHVSLSFYHIDYSSHVRPMAALARPLRQHT